MDEVLDSSCISMASDRSMKNRTDFSKEAANREQRDFTETEELDGNAIFKLVETHGVAIFMSEIGRYKKMLFPHLPQPPEREKDDRTAGTKKPDSGAGEAALRITLHVLHEIGQKELANRLEKHVYGELDVCQRKLREKLKRFEYIYEGTAQHGAQTLLHKVYTELYVTEGVSEAVNSEHEVRQIEAASRRSPTKEKQIKCEEIFNSLCGSDRFIRTVLTAGIAGIGKTISVQKFNLEWAEGRVNQDLQLLINLPFRELNLMKDRRCTLTELLHHFLTEAKESGVSDFGKYKLVLIFDGLDECRLPLDFKNNEPCSCVSEPVPVDVLLTNLFKGNLLPSGHIWITTRPAAAHRIPADCVDRVTEIRGFNDPQKKEYFRKKISDPSMATRVISHVQSARSLHIMCHIPVFSWISATVLQKILEEKGSESRREMPNTLTKMYTHFLVHNSLIKSQKYLVGDEASGSQSQAKMNEQMILKLGKLAYEQLMEGNMIFYENELNGYKINVSDTAVYSGIFTEISKNDFGIHQKRAYCFVHLSIQEYFAAMYVFHTFICWNQNLLEPDAPLTEASNEVTVLLQTAVDRALQSENGHLDLFLRFLLGLSQESDQLKSILVTMRGTLPKKEEIIEYIKEKISENPSPERCVNLFHCLSELNDQSLVEEIQKCLSSGSLSETKLSPSLWSALVFVLLTSKEELKEFDLRKYSRSEEGLRRLLPVIKESRGASLKECNLTEKCCDALTAALSSSCLKELDLSDNNLQDTGVELLSVGLRNPACQLEKLSLAFCGITDMGCGCLAEALKANPTHLKQLDLSDNDLQDTGVELLSVGLRNPACQLEKLSLAFCGITDMGCGCLAEALKANPTHLKQLDLSYNHPGKLGTELISSLQKEYDHLTIRITNSGECYLKSALKKYARELTVDMNTAHSELLFSEDKKKMTRQETAQPYPDHPERFKDWGQVLCKEGLRDRCYWEVEWSGEWIGVGVAYKGISRKGKGNEAVLGYNDQSWSLRYCKGKFTVWYNKTDDASVSVPCFKSRRVGVFLDWTAGTLSFYAVSSQTMMHLYTFHTAFTEPVYPGLRLGDQDSTLSLCRPESS